MIPVEVTAKVLRIPVGASLRLGRKSQCGKLGVPCEGATSIEARVLNAAAVARSRGNWYLLVCQIAVSAGSVESLSISVILLVDVIGQTDQRVLQQLRPQDLAKRNTGLR